MTKFVYLEAKDWGMRWAKPPVSEKLNDPEAYVHHTAGGTYGYPNDAAACFRVLNESAIQNLGYSAVAYDALIHYSPQLDVCTIGEARGKWMSAATYRRNEHGEAYCIIGYFHPGHGLSRQPYQAELEGVARAIVWGMEKGWNSYNASILGHRDNPNQTSGTVCPGNYLYAKLPQIRSIVEQLLTPTPPEVPDMAYLFRFNNRKDVLLIVDGNVQPVYGNIFNAAKSKYPFYDNQPWHKQTELWIEHRVGYQLTPR